MACAPCVHSLLDGQNEHAHLLTGALSKLLQRKMPLSTLRSYDLIVQPAMGWGNLQYKETVPLGARPDGNEDEFEQGLLVELEHELTEEAKADHVTPRYSPDQQQPRVASGRVRS